MSNGYGSGGANTLGIGEKSKMFRLRYKITQRQKKRIIRKIRQIYLIMRYKRSYRHNILFFLDYYLI